MRTTILITSAHRASLLRLAAERGEKGFSRLIGEAIEAYLTNVGTEEGRLTAAELKGILNKDEIRALEKRVKGIRERWR